MHPDVGIIRTYRRSDSLSTRPDDLNTLTCQSASRNDALRDPPHGPGTQNHASFMDTLRLRIHLRLRAHEFNPPSQSLQSQHHYVKSPPIAVSVIRLQSHHCHPKFCDVSRFRLDLPQLFFDAYYTQLFLFDYTQLFFDLIIFNFFSIKVTHFKQYPLRLQVLAWVSSKYSNTEIMEFLTILIIYIGFRENNLTKQIREVKIYPHHRLSSGNLILLTKETKKRAQWGNPLQKSCCSLELLELIPL